MIEGMFILKNKKQVPVNVLAIIGDTAYSKSVSQMLTSRYSKVAYITMGVRSRRVTCEYYEERRGKIREFTLSYQFIGNKIIYWLILPISLSIQWFTPIFLGILVARKMKVKFDVCIGESYTGVLCGLFLKKIGVVKKMAYWVSDWFPYQPTNKVGLFTFIANSVAFPYLDRFCAYKSDATWNFTQRIIDARHHKWKKDSLCIAREEVVPPPLILRRTIPGSKEGSKKKSIGFLGVLRKGQGIELAIETVSELKKQGIDITLEIMGTSYYKQYLKDYAKKLDVDDRVVFHGYIKDEKKVTEILQECICGLALFQVGKENYTYYTWPSKVGFYLECGIPVIITRSALVADEIEKKRLGIVVNLDIKSISDAIYTLSSDDNLLKECKENISRFVQARSSGKDMNNAMMRLLNMK